MTTSCYRFPPWFWLLTGVFATLLIVEAAAIGFLWQYCLELQEQMNGLRVDLKTGGFKG
jgi:hypothetical protein